VGFGDRGFVPITGQGRVGLVGVKEILVARFVIDPVHDGREVEPPHLARMVPGDAIRVADVLRQENVALRCAQRALDIVAANRLDEYRDATPIYVRLAEVYGAPLSHFLRGRT